ncbi:MAG TPA: helix-turn-helix transcriptional regulator [Cyclobacteriaceae bacterium]|nr:helix-turn-helix transcriptional regulator [Cyclobacteriaceae bacterium]
MNNFVTVLCWIGVAQSILLGVFFVSRKGGRASVFLGLMFLMIGLRVTKSILYLTMGDAPLWLINAGFAAHACIAPALFLYFRTGKWQWAHFVVPGAILLLSNYLTLDGFWYRGGYGVLLYYTIAYLALSWYHYFKNRNQLQGFSILALLIAVSIFQISYFSNYILRLTPYEAGPVIHSIMVYAISFMVLKSNDLIPGAKKKYTNLKINDTQLEEYRTRILSVMESKRPYIDPGFSLSTLSDLTGIQAHVLSFVFTASIKKNFQLFTNSYRVEAAKVMLLDPSKKHYSIAGISEECGFNSLSSFNTAFKKIAGQTPSEFRIRRK